ncbi:hypothetical protein [Microtetraspora sp. AC03309]|nr:hypothetical protein [Microtetraspora sp. AC03309]
MKRVTLAPTGCMLCAGSGARWANPTQVYALSALYDSGLLT